MTTVLDRLENRLKAFIGDIDPSTLKGRKRAKILEVATQCFTVSGYRATSMEEIAHATGVAKGTLYLYFPTKFDLLLACTSFEKLSWVPKLRAILESSAPPAERLRQWFTFNLLTVVHSPLFAALLERNGELEELMRETPPELRTESELAFVEMLSPLVEGVVDPGHRWNAIEIRDRCNVIRGMMHLAPLLRHEWMRPGIGPDRFAAILADLLVVGLSASNPTKENL